MKIPYWPLLLGPSMSFGLGFLMNAVACAANGGQMPVLYPGGSTVGYGSAYGVDTVHVAMNVHTHLKFLCDWIIINGMGIASPGDFLEWSYDLAIMPCLYMWIALTIRGYGKTE